MKVSRREARSSASRVVTIRPAGAHMAVTSLTQPLSHIDAIANPAPAAISTATAGAEATAAVASPMPAIAETTDASAMPLVPVMPVIGAVDAATARTAHIRLNASATAAHRAGRVERATPAATDMGTRTDSTESPIAGP